MCSPKAPRQKLQEVVNSYSQIFLRSDSDRLVADMGALNFIARGFNDSIKRALLIYNSIIFTLMSPRPVCSVKGFAHTSIIDQCVWQPIKVYITFYLSRCHLS